MTPFERVQVAKLILIDAMSMDGVDPVHCEYLYSLIEKLDKEIFPIAETITEEASRILFEESVRICFIVINKRDKKPNSHRITKKVSSQYFTDGVLTYEGFAKMKSSRYGISMLNMNFNQFIKGIKK